MEKLSAHLLGLGFEELFLNLNTTGASSALTNCTDKFYMLKMLSLMSSASMLKDLFACLVVMNGGGQMCVWVHMHRLAPASMLLPISQYPFYSTFIQEQ